ncbi:glycosyltransferase [Pseudanabaena sp. FACHB-2040]|uniref:glycosyltransferase family protein n=1 Tax=Pseudanabaena sp. FACHB-2040 TaxID=2692859 RepID=UPI001688AE60|nr:glycosyltransferase [Pseudanabaena sp. FACHB-2040]MBD2257548.1 glycosyltransferase family 1 protein [Pseudanabaena sp. FACHB-2040]
MQSHPIKFFATSLGNWFMIEIAQIFIEGIRQSGIEAELLIDVLPSKTDKSPQVIVAPHEFYPLFFEEEKSDDEIIDLTQSVYFLTVEQPGSSWFEIAYNYARYTRGVFDINAQGVSEFKQRGIEAVYAPLGLSPCLELKGHCAETKSQEIDLLFMGVWSNKRERFISKYASFFNAFRSQLIITRLEKPRSVNTPGFYTGKARNELLASSKILVNVHSSDRTYLEWHRVLVALANRCLVVSETSEAIEPLVSGQHFIMCDLDEIPAACEYYLKHEEERLSIVNRAYEFLKREHTSALLAAPLLEKFAVKSPVICNLSN